jgi:hypothetical protein
MRRVLLAGGKENRSSTEKEGDLRKLVLQLGVVVMAMFLVSCATTVSVETNKDPGYDKVLGTVAILAQGRGVVVDWDATTGQRATFDNYVPIAIESALTAAGVTAKGIVQTGLELDQNIAKSQVQAFGATSLMVATLVRGIVSQGRNGVPDLLSSGTIEVTLQDVALNRVVWIARLEVRKDGAQGTIFDYVGKDGIDRAVKEIVAALQKDGLLLTK